MSAPRDKGTAAQQPQLIKILEGLLKLPENKDCVDCGTKAPRWASTNLGVFMCIRCSGIHRSLGVHISKVKSVSLDKWSPEQVEFMQKIGNGKGKEVYEAHVPSTYHRGNIATDNMALEQWIRDKYERRRFMARDGAEPATHREYKDQRPRDSGRGDYGRERDSGRGDYGRESGRERDSGRGDYGRDSGRERDSGRDRDFGRERDSGRDAGRERESARPTQAPIRAPAPTAKQPVATPAKDSFDLLNFDEPARTPQEVAPVDQDADFFGDFNTAGTQNNQGVAAPPQKDKNAILQLFNAPPVMPGPYSMHGMPGMQQPPPMVYPGPNYNVSLQQGAFPLGYNPNYNMGRGYAGPQGGMPNFYPPQTGYPGQGYPPQPGYPAYPPQTGYSQQGYPQQGYSGQQQYSTFGGQSASPSMGAQGRGAGQQPVRAAQPATGAQGTNNLISGLNSLNFHL